MNCTVITPIKGQEASRVVTREDLYQADFQFAVPFALPLEQGELFAEQIVRLMPGKRMVVFGHYLGKPVVAKLYYDKKRAIRHFHADLSGIQTMLEYKIPTPALCFAGKSADLTIHVIVLDRVMQAQNLETLWQQHGADDNTIPLLHALIVELATQHVLGVCQRDLHLGNFLFARNTVLTLDGAQIEVKQHRLERQESIESLALLLSQLGAGVKTLQESLFLHYAKARGWLVKPADMTEMLYQIRKSDATRWQHYQKKIFRNATDFVAINRLGCRAVARRDAMGSELKAFLQHPDAVFARQDITMLKNGRSSTVIKVKMDGCELVVKRYNIKNIFHRLRRMLRDTRAKHSWRLAHKMKLFNINTPQPIAYLESNWFGLRGKSYFVAEYIHGEDVKQFLMPHANELYQVASVTKQVCTLLTALESIEMTHGDLKATNIIIDAAQKPYLIDLDGAREHASAASLQKAALAEKQRFLKNFSDCPAIADLFARLLGMKS